MLNKNQIYCMNCFEFLDIVDNNSVQLAVIDPPYNMKKADWDTFSTHEIFLDFTYRWVDKVIDKLDKNGSIYIFNTPFNCTFICQYLVQKGLVF